MKHWWKYIPKK